MKGLFLTVMPLAIAITIAFFTPVFTSEATDSTVVARVNGVAITKADLDVQTNRLLPRIFFHSDVSPEKRKKAEKKALENLIEEELFYQEAKRQGIKAERSEIKERLEAIKKRYPSKRAFNEAMDKYKLTIPMLEERIRKEILVERLLRKEVSVNLSDKDVADYYNQNREKFKMPESVKVRYIWVKIDPTMPDASKKAEDKAKEAYQKLKAGEDFAKIAWNYSSDMSRVKGGDVGYIHKGRFADEVERVAFSLKVGQMSNIIKTETGYHIIRIEDKRPPRQIPFGEIREKLKEELTQSQQSSKKDALLKRLRSNAMVEYLLKE